MNKKYMIVGGLALVINLLLIGFLYSRNNTEETKLKEVKILEPDVGANTAPVKRLATFMLDSGTATVKSRSVVAVKVSLSSPETLLGADAVILYDPEMLRVKKLESGNMFPNYPRVLDEPDKGRIVVTGVNIDNEQLVGNLFATIEFIALKSGSADISFVHKLEDIKGSTAIRADDGENILTHVEDLQILIQ